MSGETHIAEDDLVLFALQFLPEDQMREVRRYLAGCDTCRLELARLQGDLVAYAMTAEVVAPSAEARDRLTRQVAKEPRLTPVPEPLPGPRSKAKVSFEPVAPAAASAATAAIAAEAEPAFAARGSRAGRATEEAEPVETRRPSRAPWVLAWTGWIAAAGLSFVAGLELHQRQILAGELADQRAETEQVTQDAQHAQDALATLTAANARQVELHTPVTKPGGASPALPEAIAAYLPDKGALVFVATHLQPAVAGKTYELWLLPGDDTKSAVPVGTFKPDAQGSANLVMPHLPQGVAAKGFEVTEENDGGASTPTPPTVMEGKG